VPRISGRGNGGRIGATKIALVDSLMHVSTSVACSDRRAACTGGRELTDDSALSDT
jgi:hypothetical protein